jgi:hypothetical protein
MEDKHLTSCNAWLGWTARDANMCFCVPIERWTWREGLGWKLHNLSQVGVYFKFQWKENSTNYWLGHTKISSMHYSKSNLTLVHLSTKKIVWFLLISLGGQPWHFFPFGDRPLWLVHHPKQKISLLTHWHTPNLEIVHIAH